MNSIIGGNHKILESTISECTKANFIIKDSNSEKISLWESRLIENHYGDYFENQYKEIKFNDNEDLKNKRFK